MSTYTTGPRLAVYEPQTSGHHPCPACGEDTKESQAGLDVYLEDLMPAGSVCQACAQYWRPDLLAECHESWSVVEDWIRFLDALRALAGGRAS